MKLWLTTLLLSAPLPALAACPPVPSPLINLSFESRYVDDDPTRSEIDLEAEADAKDALAAVDDFITDLTNRTDTAVIAEDVTGAACVMEALAVWADADALSELGTQTVELTIGSRLAALALIAIQVAPVADAAHLASVTAWLARRMDAQMEFWETAPDGAASGNLRAWAGLTAASVALLTDDKVTLGWAAWSISYVACTANLDGSLPQEMSRKHLALHYQVHAVAPLTVAAALLEQQGVSVLNRCGRALDRIVAFTLDDIAAGGARSEALAGAPQTLNAGFDSLKDFQLAWGEAWLSLKIQPNLEAAILPRRPLNYSKLGGNQSRIWAAR
ncbi:MAG: poly(beta-D-mannuronate) lyase [Candidatus Azotimanducaceae bacterium]|jgi:poly(beta-D-mannuronate) lyase